MRSLVFLMGCSALAACGGGSGGGGTGGGGGSLPTAPANTPLTTVINAQSAYVGISIEETSTRSAPGSNVFNTDQEQTGRVTGTYNHSNGVATTSGNLTASSDTHADTYFFGRDITGFDFVSVSQTILSPPEGETVASDSRYTKVVFGGIPTDSADIPNTAGATAQMTGVGLIVLPGVSSVSDTALDIDFGAGLVDVTLTPRSTSPRDYDDFEVNGMAISGSAFSGGTAVFTNTRNGFDPLANLTSTFSEGQFFGLDASGTGPDEAAGVIKVETGSGGVDAQFLAD